ncbi:MAG TPA: NAD-dependent epimerase/dehydratase family protein [Chitinophagaceae bacterium]|jgi:UDP-glucuronate 4-epimerase|nr:NAD-dependent epimerase/dehydratase family protein [Chitinophagaceae bacterium]
MNKQQKHYLVTGGAGFIGSHVVRALLQDEGIKITCIDSFDPFYPRQLKLRNMADFDGHHNFFLLDVDLAKVTVKELFDAINQPVDVIIHLAAKAGVRPSIADPLAYQETNILGTQKLLDFAVQKKVEQFVFASSSSIYGINDHFPWKEEEQLLPISPYAQTKLAGEMAGHTYSHLYGLPFIALRFFTVYGPGQRPDLAIHRFVRAIHTGQPVTVFGDGTTSRDYTYVEDIVQGILAAVRYRETPFEIINLGNNYAIPLNELIAAIEDVMGKKAAIDRQPEQPGDVPRTFADISKAQRLLGYKPATPLRQGLEQFYRWFEANRELLLRN